jgi:hypothetical protein
MDTDLVAFSTRYLIAVMAVSWAIAAAGAYFFITALVYEFGRRRLWRAYIGAVLLICGFGFLFVAL